MLSNTAHMNKDDTGENFRPQHDNMAPCYAILCCSNNSGKSHSYHYLTVQPSPPPTHCHTAGISALILIVKSADVCTCYVCSLDVDMSVCAVVDVSAWLHHFAWCIKTCLLFRQSCMLLTVHSEDTEWCIKWFLTTRSLFTQRNKLHILHTVSSLDQRFPWWLRCLCVVFFFLSVTLNRCENFFQVSPLWCGACGLPITQFWWMMWISEQPCISGWRELCTEPAPCSPV